MSILSFDFTALENQLQRLGTLESAVDKTTSDIYEAISYISEMELGDAGDKLRHSYSRLNEEKNKLSEYIARLRKISELYAQCESSILGDVDSLPLNMPKQTRKSPSLGLTGRSLSYFEQGTYFGNSIINDDRLEKLIFKKEGLK